MFTRATAATAFAAVLSLLTPAHAQVTGAAGQLSDPPSPLERRMARPALAPGHVMIDDMIFEEARFERAPDVSGTRSASFESYTARPWEFGLLPIEFDPSISDTRRNTFFIACELWAATGVRCVQRTTEPAWVRVTVEDDGCYAKVGMGTRGPQPINLGEGCWRAGTIAHEIGHAFGLVHEHQRADRDTYVTINFANVEEGTEGNFTRITTSRLWTPYDFTSLMHYSRTAFAKQADVDTITPTPEYASQATGMGQRTSPSSSDLVGLTSIYNLAPRVYRLYPLVSRQFTIGRQEALEAMAAINSYYVAPTGLARADGLSIDGRPDFLGLAAWFFDIYVKSRYAGYEPVESRYNVMASITQTDEWRAKNPGRASALPLPINSSLPFDRTELLAVMERLDRFYSAPEGLQRTQGLSLNGQPDFQGIAAWLVDVYMGGRLGGASADAAWQLVVFQIQQTDEWRGKH